MVDWRKDIKLSDLRPRKDEDADFEFDAKPDLEDEDAAKTEQTSLLKKEISFKRKRKPKPPRLDEPELDDADDDENAEQTSLLKKEISFKRKRKPRKPLAEAEIKDDEPRPAPKRKRKASAQRPGHKRVKRVVGLKIGGSQLAAARIVNNGHPELVQIAREDLE